MVAAKNDTGWVTTGASNLEELNLLMKEVMLRRKKDEVVLSENPIRRGFAWLGRIVAS
jgi:hypothetical protein